MLSTRQTSPPVHFPHQAVPTSTCILPHLQQVHHDLKSFFQILPSNKLHLRYPCTTFHVGGRGQRVGLVMSGLPIRQSWRSIKVSRCFTQQDLRRSIFTPDVQYYLCSSIWFKINRLFVRSQMVSVQKSWLPKEFFLAQSNALLFDTGCVIGFLPNGRKQIKKYPYVIIFCVFVHNLFKNSIILFAFQQFPSNYISPQFLKYHGLLLTATEIQHTVTIATIHQLFSLENNYFS